MPEGRDMKMSSELKRLIKKHKANTAIIRYRTPEGKIVTWAIGAIAGKDNEATLREHLNRYYPSAEFIGFVIK